MRAPGLLSSVLLLAGSTQAEPRVTVLADAGLGVPAQQFETTRPVREFAEDGRLDARYEAGRGTAFGGAMQVRVARRLAVLFGGTVSRRDETGTWEARLPHPLYLDRDRFASGALSGTWRETEVFAALGWTGGGRRTDLRVFAGPSFSAVSADSLRSVRYAHAYPYDEVTVTDTTVSARDGTGFGFTVGAGADYRFGERLGLGVQGRFRRASVAVQGGDLEPELDLQAGGLDVTGGLRVRF